jgi:hypothetical protein
MWSSRRRLWWPALLAAILGAFWACHLENDPGDAFMDVRGDLTWTQYDTLLVVLMDPSGHPLDTLFEGKLNALDELSHLRAKGYAGQPAKIVILGKQGGVAVFREERAFDGANTTRHDTLLRPESGPSTLGPTVDLGPADTSVLLNEPLVLTARVALKSGFVAVFAWDLDGDGKYEDSTVAPPKTQTVFATPAKAYAAKQELTAKVYVRDGGGNAATAGIRITVSDKVPRITAITPAATLSIMDSLAFSAQVSEPGGALKRYWWDYDGDGKADDSGSLSGSGATVAGGYRFAKAATYKASLRVVDANNTPVTGIVNVTVLLDPPAADAGRDTVVDLGALVRLHGTGRDSLGRIVREEWKIGAGEFNRTTGDTAFIPGAAGLLICVFRAIDDDGQAAEDTVKITVNAANGPVVSDLAVAKAVVTIRDSLVFTAKVEDRFAELKAFAWDYDGDGKADATGPVAGASATVVGAYRYAKAGDITLGFTVTDAQGKSGSSVLHLSVRQDLPTAEAGNDTAVKMGSLVRLRGVATDTLGTIVKREWKIGAAGAYSATASGDTSFTPATQGSVVCWFRATDDDDQQAVDSLTVSVSDSKPPAITGLAASAATVTINDTLIFSATAVPGDAPLAKYAWDYDGDGKDDDSTKSAATAALPVAGKKSYAAPGAFTVRLRVTDAKGISATDQLKVTVKQDLPVANAGADTGVAAGALVKLRGTAVDSLGKIVLREWKIGTGAYTATSGNDTSFAAPLVGGLVTCFFRVTDDDGQQAEDFLVVTVAPSTDNDLKSLSLSAGSIAPAFAPGTFAYTLSVPNSAATTTVTAASNNSGAALQLVTAAAAVPLTSGTASVAQNLDVGANDLTVVVTSQSGVKQNYKVIVTRAAAANADLATLVPSTGSLVPAFTASNIAYTMTVPNATSSIAFTPTYAATGATITVNGRAVLSGAKSADTLLAVGATVVSIVVTAPDKVATKTYKVTVTRQASSDANLKGLSVDSASLVPPFSPLVTNYYIQRENFRIAARTTATANDAGATIACQGAMTSGVAKSLPIYPGSTPLKIDVTAQDGVTKKTYTLTSYRAADATWRLGYAWVDQVTSSHTLSGYAYSTSSGAISFTRIGLGKYKVSFAGMGGNGILVGGNAQANAYGDSAGYCKVNHWDANGADFDVFVDCYSPAGAAHDDLFTTFVTWPRSGSTGPNGYVRHELNPSVPGLPDPTYAFNSGNRPVAYVNVGVGNAEMDYQGLDTSTNALMNGLITGYGSDPNRCNAYVMGGPFDVGTYRQFASCYTPAGAPVDGEFSAYFAEPFGTGSPVGLGYAYVTGDAAIGTPTSISNRYSYNSASGGMVYTHTGTGVYSVTFTALGAVNGARGGMVQVNMNEGGGMCKVAGWSGGTDMSATVKCFSATGVPTDWQFMIWMVQ